MKKFKFSMEKVLRHREILLNLAEKDLIEAQLNLNQQINLLEELLQQKDQALSQRSELVKSTSGWTALVEQINHFLIGQEVRLKIQKEKIHQLQLILEEKRELVHQASKQVKIFENLKNKKFDEFKKEYEDKEQKELDELTVLRFAKY